MVSSMAFLFRHSGLVGWSILLVMITAFFTSLGYFEAIQFINSLTGHFFQAAPAGSGILGWLTGMGWVVMKYLFLIITRITSFYLAFLVSYCLTTPGYIFLSGAVEKTYGKNNSHMDQQEKHDINFKPSRISIILTDLLEGIKIGLIGILVTIVALAVNFIPIIGQMLVFLIYVFYSALMFIDYPASNRHWTLRQKINWVGSHYRRSLRIGILPAMISMIPFINIFFMALFFPLFTVHTTLNFIAVQGGELKKTLI